MKGKSILYILLLLIILSASIGIVCASEDIADSTTDSYSPDEIVIYEGTSEVSSGASSDEAENDVSLGVTNDVSFKENESKNTSQIASAESKSLLGISNEEDYVLQARVIPVTGMWFGDVRNAIDQADNGDIIDLGGREIVGSYPNGNPSISTDKQLTFINGIFNAGNVTSININKRNFIQNCKFENITFKNFNDTCMYPNFFINCTLRHVTFENFTLAVAGFVIRNSDLYDVNFTNCHSLAPEDENDYEYAAMAVTYNSVLDHCNFVNCTTNRHSGAICIAGENGNRVDVFNSNFINCSAGVGGAIYVHGNKAINENYHSNIINCTFIGNSATQRGGALGSSQNYLVVKNCTFENNTAKQGAAYMLAGISHGLDGIPEGHYNTIVDCYFRNNTGTEEGGAVHITGNNNAFVNCTFWDNYATNGNGSAIYIHGENSSVIDSDFHEHECSRGTVFIIGNNTLIDGSTFDNNSASRGGAGVYVVGYNTLVNNSVFNNNDAIYHGGALHSEGDNLRVLNSNFTSNTAIASTDNMEQGLGGAIYIKGNNSNISQSYFENNIARNGSAIYNRGQNLTIEDDTFIENQAWSYLLTTVSDKERIYYDPDGVVTINVTHKGGDNIINAIYNDGSPDNIFFLNVTYESSVNKTQNTGNVVINPVDSVEKSENGTLIYQDAREDLQNITIIVTHLETGQVVINFTSQTGILGNTSVSERGLLPGNYSVNVTHIEDGLYKFITNTTYFEILPVADLAIEKFVSDKTPDFGDEIVWTLKVTNNGYNDATNAYVIDKLPNGLIFVDSDGNYNATTGRWDIGDLAYNETVYLKIRTVVNITNTTILNIATVNSSTYDPNETNNIANNTTKPNTLADLAVIKLVSKETSVIGDEIVWTIVVTNNGPDIAVNAYAIDKLPSGLLYKSDDSQGKYNSTSGRWDIGDLAKGDTATLKIITKINTDNTTIVNNVFVNSSTPESNTTNNNASNKTKVLESNFEVEKITITPLVTLGDQVTFQIVVRNTGLTDLTDVFIEESSYDGLIFSHNLTQTHWKHSIVNGKHRWTLINKLGVDELASLTLVFNTTKEGNFTNVVVAGSNETENKTAKNNTTVVTPKFAVEKLSLTPFVSVGDQVIFEIVVTNTGLVDITDMFVEEFEYDGLVFDYAYRLGNWVKDNNANIWRYSKVLTPGAVTSFFVVFNTTKEGNFTNIVVAGANKTDNKTVNNTTEVVEPKFVVEKLSLNPLVAVGEQVTFEIAVTNTGRIDLNGVFVVESEYDGLVFDHAYGLGDHWVESVEDNKHKWTYKDVLTPGNAHGFFVVFNTTKAGNFTNVVVVGANKTDNKTGNNTTEVVEPKFVVEKLSLNPLVAVGEQVTFEIAVTNTGRIDLNGVFVVESEYDGLVFDHAYGLGDHWVESVEDNKHKWTYKDVLTPGNAHGFFVVFNTTKAGNFTNVVVAGANNTENKSANNTTEVVKPEFSVEKIALDPVVHVNNLTKFEIVIQNTGKVPITGLFLEETDYQNLTYKTFIDTDDWFYVINEKYSWTYPKVLKPGDIVTLIVVFNATEVGNWTNTVTAGAKNVENKTANNTTEVLENPPYDPEWNASNPNISIEKIALDNLVIIGNTVIFEIVVRNTGDKRLHNVTVHEKFDDGLEFIRMIDNSELWIDNNDLSFTLNSTLYKGETLKFYVEFNTTKLGVLRNIVNVSSNETENKTANDTVEVVEPKLEINKVAVNSTVFVGSQVVFEILVRNTGKVDLNNVLVKETSYDGLTYDGWYDDAGLWTKNNDLSWSLKPKLVPGEYLGFFVVFNTTKVGNFTNVVVVKSDEVPNETDNDTVKVLKPELSISKVAINNIAEIGDQVTFEILVRNTGQVPLNNLVVNETSFDGLIYDTWHDDTGLWIKNNDLSWSLKPTLSVGEYLGFFVVFNTTKVGNFTNVVVVKSDEVPNETANDTVEVFKPEYTIEKVTINQTVLVGEQVIFEIIVHNTGKININNITVTESEYDGLIYDGWYDETGLWAKNNDLSWTSKYDIYPNGIIGFYVVFNTTKEGTFENVVVAQSEKLPNKTANDTVDVLKHELTVEKITVNNTVVVGEQVIFEIIVRNSGGTDLNNVTVRELEFNGLTYDSWFDYTSKWIKNNDLSWTYNSTLPSNKHGYFYVVFNTTTAGNFTNIIVAKSNNTNNTYANNTTTVIGADLAIKKFVSNSTPNFGDVIEWTIVVVNNGPADSKGAYVIDKLPVGLVYQSDDSQGKYNSTSGRWDIGDLAFNKTVTLVIKTLVNISNATILNVATVNSSTYDPNETNNVGNNTTDVNPAADLAVEKFVSNSTPNYGDVIEWTIVVTNIGPDVAVAAYVIDKLPVGLVYQSDDSRGKYNSTSGRWDIGDLAKGANASLVIKTLVNISNATILNVATVNSSTYDPNETNNVGNNTTDVNPAADLAVEKFVSNSTPNYGDVIEWTIVVTNIGPDVAVAAYVIDKLPVGLVYQSDDSQGKYNSTSGRWDIGDLAFNKTVTLVIKTLVNISNATILNVATVNSSTYDPNETNNVGNNTTDVNPAADLAVEKFVSNSTPNYGDVIEWTIVVTNIGPDVAVGVYVIDKLPVGLVYQSDDSRGKYNSTSGRWDIGDLAKGANASLVIKTLVNISNATILNVATVNSSTYDPNETNNVGNNTTDVNPAADLAVEKFVSNSTPNYGDVIEWTIVVTNIGPDVAVGVYVIDKLPAGLVYQSDDSQGKYNSTSGRWDIGDLAFNKTVTLVIKTLVNISNATILNVATVNSSTYDPNETNNVGNNTTDVNPIGEIAVEKICLTPIVNVGGQVTFEIVVQNIGGIDLNNVYVIESEYDGLVFDHAYGLGNHWVESNENGKRKWTYNDVFAVNNVHGFFVVFNTTKEGNFTNVVVAGGKNTENKTTNNTTTVVNPEFTVEKIALDPVVHVNNLTTFEIVIKNVGKTPLTGVFIEETNYEGLTYYSFIDTKEWTYTFDVKPKWELIKSLQPNEVATLRVIFNATKVGNWTNLVTAGANGTENKTANNNTTVYVDEPPVVPEGNNSNITIEKIALEKVILVGSQVTFEIVVHNTGDRKLNNITVYEKFTEGLVFDHIIDASSSWIQNNDLSFTLNRELLIGETVKFYIVFNATKVGSLTNVVTVTSNETENKTSNDTIKVVEPKFDVNKIALNKTVIAGQQVTFEIVVHNNGEVAINNLTVYESSFDGLTYASWLDNTGLWIKNNDLSWTLNSGLLAGEYLGFLVVFNTTEAGNFTNVIVAKSDETPNKTSNDSVKVLKPELKVKKVTVNQTVVAGQQVIFEIIVENIGETELNDVIVRELEFNGLTYAGWYDNTGKWIKNNDLTWTLSSKLALNETASFFVVFNTTDAGNFTNVIVAKSNNTNDTYANNTTTVIGADLSIEKLVSNSSPNFGDVIEWTIVVVNNGPADSKGVYVIDKLPAGLVYQSDDSQGKYNSTSGRWDIGDLAFNKTVTLVIKTLVNISNATILNVATVNSSTYDPNETNNVGNNTTDVNPAADLAVEKFVSNSTPNYGDVIEWTIVVTNNGPDASKDVNVIDKLPAGLFYQSDDSQGRYNPTTGVWTVGDLANGATAKLVIKTLVNIANSTIVNVATVNSSTYDPNKDNNNANNTTNIKPAADLIISKVVVNIDGDNVTWGIAVKNLGPDTAINTRVVDVLPKALQFVSYNASKGAYDSITGVWSIGDLANGEEAFILIETVVLGTGEIVNEARVESDTYDPDMTNNYDYDSIVVEDIPDVEPVNPPEVVNELPATGNPLIMVLLALIALGTAALRRRK